MIDLNQKKQTLTLSIFLGIVIVSVIVGAVLLMPELAHIGNDIFGDGLLGEVQFLLASYVGMFVINWLLIAWIF